MHCDCPILHFLHPRTAFVNYYNTTHYFRYFFRHQAIAEIGGPQPKKESLKTGHLAATMTGPAKGKMYPNLWTYAGVENNRDMLGGTKHSYAQKTPKGWPDEVTVRIWARLVVKERNSRGIDRCLMLVDNADVHMDPEVSAFFIKNKVILSGLIKSGTGFQQPLDVDGFGQMGGSSRKRSRILCRLRHKNLKFAQIINMDSIAL